MKSILTTLFASFVLAGFAAAGECGGCKKGGEHKEEEAVIADGSGCKKGGCEKGGEHEEEEAALAGDCKKCKKGEHEEEEAALAGDCKKCKKGEHEEEEAFVA